jgi:crossover junction endodeoxyribonuclease RuvC
MIIAGIDPGIGRVGWGIIQEAKGKLKTIDFGCFETLTQTKTEQRLLQINQFLNQLFKKYRPGLLAIEELFFAANVKTAIMVGQARGAILLSAAQAKIPIYSYTPLQVKQALTGYGRAEKKQIQAMVKAILNLSCPPKPDDAADALAIAITHAFSYKLQCEIKKL